jgi:hypothetical protein
MIMKKSLLIMSLMVGTSNLASAVTPEQILADGIDASNTNGVVLRKGSIGAFINNVMYLNDHLKQPGSSDAVLKAIKDMRDAMPVQHSQDLFKVFSINDWFESEDKPGTVMAGVLFLQQFPAHYTPEVKERLVQLSKKVHPLLKTELTKLIN